MSLIIPLLALAAMAMVCTVLGLKLAAILREQFDELMPQRMIDYSGFVNPAVEQD